MYAVQQPGPDDTVYVVEYPERHPGQVRFVAAITQKASLDERMATAWWIAGMLNERDKILN